MIFNAACDAVQRDGSTLQSKILELDSFGVDCTIYGKTIRVKNMIAAVEGGIAAGRILSAADVAAIAGCTKEELDKYFHDTSVFVGYSMHDIQGTIWELKDGLTQIYNFYHALYSGEAEIRTGTNFVDTDGVHWYGAGVYAIQQNGYSYDATTNKLSLSCLDMTCLLDGTLGGTLTGYATRIPMYDRKLVVKDGVNYYEDDKKKPHYVRDSIKETFELSGLTKSMVDYWVRRIPHDLEYNTGTTIWNILTELRDLYFPFEMYFDDDTFVCKEIPSGYDDPVVLDEDTFKSMVISEDASVDYGQIHNCVEVWGASNSSDYFCKDGLLSKLSVWTATPTDDTYFMRQDTGGGNSFGRVKFSTIWSYIKGKADGVYQPKGSYAASSHSHTKDQVGLGNVDNTADSVKSVAVANFAKETYINRYKTVNLTDLDQNTWYPVTGTGVSYNGLRHFKCNVQLNSGSKPSWSTHSAGFTAVVDILEESSGWGTTGMLGEVLINDRRFIADESKPPVGYGQLGNSSIPVWWLRGGGTYFLAADYDCTWTIRKSKFEKNGQSVEPRTTYPGVNVNRSTITANLNGNATTADVANAVDWSKVQNKPSSYAPASHTHDDRYYTESEVNTKLANYQPKGNYAAASHTHNYAGSGTAGGSANSAIKLDSSAGSATRPVYFSGGKPVAIGYTIAKSVPADAKFTDTNTWRGIQNNLTSDSTDQSLSAAQGKALKTLVDGKAPISHTHKKSQITDFPSSMPASDVYAWAKAATKPSYTKAEVGLGNVDNTADKNKSVNYATSAGLATNAQCLNNDDKYMKFHWSGQKGQPTWLWGGNDSGDMYVYNPSNFNVNYATTAGNGTVDFQTKVTTDGYFGAVRFGNGVQICWFTMKSARNRTFLLPFADINYAIAFSGGYCWLNVNNRTTTGFTVGVEWSGYENSYIAIGRWK